MKFNYEMNTRVVLVRMMQIQHETDSGEPQMHL